MYTCPYCGAPATDPQGRPLPVCPRCRAVQPGYAQWAPPPPGYGYPPVPPKPAAFIGVTAILGFALGVVSLLMCWLTLYNIFLLPAVVLSIIGCIQCYRRQTMVKFSIAAVIVTAIAVAATAGVFIFDRLYTPPGYAPPVATEEHVDTAARGVAAIQEELGPDASPAFHKMILKDQDGFVQIYMELTAGGRLLRYAVSTDKGMADMGATTGWWDEEREVAVFDYTLAQSVYDGTPLDIGEVLEKAADYGYVP